MLKEELPAIISIAFIAAVFLAAFLQDMLRVRAHFASLDESANPNKSHVVSIQPSSTDEAMRYLSQEHGLNPVESVAERNR